MYLGKIVELATTEELLANPLHPYTKALLSAVPVPDPSYRRTPVEIKGGISKAINPPPVCRFIERCPWAADISPAERPPPLEDKGNGQYVACYLVDRRRLRHWVLGIGCWVLVLGIGYWGYWVLST